MEKKTNPLDPPGIWDNSKNVKKLLYGFFTICGILFLLDFLVHRHMVHSWEHLWGFYPIFGWAGSVCLVLVAKELRKVLMRTEDYYDR